MTFSSTFNGGDDDVWLSATTTVAPNGSEGPEPVWMSVVRDYVLPLLVLAFMWYYLLNHVIVPFFRSGMHNGLSRQGGTATLQDDDSDVRGGDEGSGTALRDDNDDSVKKLQ